MNYPSLLFPRGQKCSLGAFGVVLFLGLCTLPLRAQQPAPGGISFDAGVSVSGVHGSTWQAEGGSADTLSWSAKLRGSWRGDAGRGLSLGVDFTHKELSGARPDWVPGELESVGFTLGYSQPWTKSYSMQVLLMPRFSSAAGDFGADAFDLPVMLLLTHKTSDQFAWSAGLRYSRHSEASVLPLLGLNWKPTKQLTFQLAWPETGLFYRPNHAWAFKALASVEGGDYALKAADYGVWEVGGPSTHWLRYRDVRSGLGIEYSPASRFVLNVEGGLSFFRRASIEALDLAVSTGAAPYFRADFRWRF